MASLLSGLPIELRDLTAYPDVPGVEETGETYEENARLKAAHYARATALTAVGEDSGFEVDALGGEPGVRSARFLGPEASYPERFHEIYRRLGGRGGSPARFVCALALATPDGVVFETRQTVEGVLAPAPRGSQGFGYDPILLIPPLGRTLAELTQAEKSAISHRGQAVRALRAFLESR
jgi:XTP/dITP diphosphohydrolase